MYTKYEFSTNDIMGALFFIFNDITKNKKSLRQTEDNQNLSEEIQSDSE